MSGELRPVPSEGLAPYSISEYSSDQWWYAELEKIWNLPAGDSVTPDMKRAAHIAMNLMKAVEGERT